MTRRPERALGLLFGSALDLLIADPRRAHPVAAFGGAVAAAERRSWADERARGALFTLAFAGGVAVLGVLVERAGRGVAVALSTWAVLGGTTLAREGSAMGDLLGRDDVVAARARVGHLCGRDPEGLDRDGLTRATVESVAENTSDAVVAPLLWGAVAGVPGLLTYRAVNTLDAMIGHRDDRYARFGWTAARLDDVANYVPARVTCLLTALLAPLVGGSTPRALRAVRRDASAHPSPNAGPVEAAFAGALGVRLGGTNVYGGRAEVRGVLGDGHPPTVDDIDRAVRLSRLVGVAALAIAVAVSWRRR